MDFLLDLALAVIYGSVIGMSLALNDSVIVFLAVCMALLHTKRMRKQGG